MKSLYALSAVVAAAAVMTLGAGVANAQDGPVAIESFEGPQASKMRKSVIASLKKGKIKFIKKAKADAAGADLSTPEGRVKMGQETGAAAYITATVKRGKRWTVNVVVYNLADGSEAGSKEFKARKPRALAGVIKKKAFSELKDILAATSAPKKAAVAAPPPKEEPEEEKEPEEETPEAPEEPDTPSEPSEDPALIARVGMHLISRSLAYNDDVWGSLRPYDLGLAPAPGITLETYPGAFVGGGWMADIGLRVHYERSFGLESEDAQSNAFPTTYSLLNVGALYRLGLGPLSVKTGVGFFAQEFEIDKSSVADPPDIPSVAYNGVDLGLSLGMDLGLLELEAAFKYMVVFDTGEIEKSFFRDATADGYYTALTIAYPLFAGLSADLTVDWTRFAFTFGPEVGDVFVAGGATDDYYGANVGVSYEF